MNGVSQHTLPVSDRGLQYGDGVWETVLVSSCQLILFKAHLQRLRWGCRVLKLVGLDEEALKQEVHQLSQSITYGIIKIIITRGSGGRGYSAQGLNAPTRIVSLHPLPEAISLYRQKGINIQYCQSQLSHHPQLSGFKHLNCLEQVLARSELANDCQEGIVSDIQGNIIEGTMSNLFLIIGDSVITPLLTQCGIKGIMRAYIFDLLNKKNIILIEREVSMKDVNKADGIFFTNSVIGLWFVKTFNGKSFSWHDQHYATHVVTYLQSSIDVLENNPKKSKRALQ